MPGRILACERLHTFSLTYFGETVVVSIDLDVDLRNHDEARTWREGYAEN